MALNSSNNSNLEQLALKGLRAHLTENINVGGAKNFYLGDWDPKNENS